MSNSTIKWDQVHLSNFESAVFWEINWTRKARDLYESARRLEPDVLRVWEGYRASLRGEPTAGVADHYQGPYFMLLAFAVENLLKAAAVGRNQRDYKEEFKKNSKFPMELKSHDLVKLAKLVTLSVSQIEEDLLRRLARSALWFGRYPAPLNYREMSGSEQFSDGKNYSVSWFGGSDIERLNSFILSLPNRLGLSGGAWEVIT